MRQILFKAKTIDSKIWVEGDLVQRTDSDGSKHYLIENNDFNDYRSYEVIPESVGQFTGLLDKNGNKIFELDVVKIYQPHSKTYHSHIVKWDNLWSCFGLFENNNKWCKEYDWVKIKEIEIIGNIYDNPELLQP